MLNIQASSLVEVLVVLVLGATLLIAAAQTSARTLVSIKNNEIRDTATGVMIQALESAKLAGDIKLIKPESASIVGSYTISQSGELALVRRSNTSDLLDGCTSSSPYRFEPDSLEGVTEITDFCLQVVVSTIGTGANQQYELTSNIVYTLKGETIQNSITGYRRGNFNVQTSQ